MKLISGLVLMILCGNASFAQFYYKDIIVTRQAFDSWKANRDNKVKSIKITSLEPNGEPVQGFACEQDINQDLSEITTHTRSSLTSESFLISYYNANGLLKKTVDTSNRFRSTTDYQFNSKGMVSAITNTSVATDNGSKDVERHQWQYDENGKPVSMYKIRNSTDTTYYSFVKDEKGNIAEEHGTRNKFKLPVTYYYYDEQNRLTDIVEYNSKAKRLLPDYIFEYDESGRLSSMLTVPEDSNGYQRWTYAYNEKGLRTSENCFNKKRELLGKIAYQYNFYK